MNLKLLEKMPENFKFFKGKEIRTLVDSENQELWFVAKDVANILDFTSASAMSKALKDLDSDEKAELILNQVSSNGVSQNRKIIVVSESGLYSLIARSRKQVAKPFQKWLTKEVLPSIRKNGFYI
jgi:anti-repressor protein